MKVNHIGIQLVVFLLFSTTAQASITSMIKSDVNKTETSLILNKTNSTKSVEITAGQEIKVWHSGNQIIKGEFVNTQEGQILLKFNEAEERIALENIERIKVTGPNPKLGQLFLVAGFAALILGGIALITGLAAIGSESIGAIILIAVPVLGGGGWGLRSIGSKLNGKTFNLTKKWRIKD